MATLQLVCPACAEILTGRVEVHLSASTRTAVSREDRESLVVFNRLRPHQRRVLGLFLAGKSNREIAQIVGSTEHNVRVGRCRIYPAIGVKDQVELLLWVIRHPLFRKKIEAALAVPQRS